VKVAAGLPVQGFGVSAGWASSRFRSAFGFSTYGARFTSPTILFNGKVQESEAAGICSAISPLQCQKHESRGNKSKFHDRW
jgi:hypothetical protein